MSDEEKTIDITEELPLLHISVEVIEPGIRYKGKIDNIYNNEGHPIDFNIKFPIDAIENGWKMGIIPAEKAIIMALSDVQFERDGKLIQNPDLTTVFFIPITVAISLMIDRQRKGKENLPFYYVPFFCQEMNMFGSPDELTAYVLYLNPD